MIGAYLASAARAGSWIVLTALLFRTAGKAEFSMLALVRATVGLLAYAALGLGPAMIRMLAQQGQTVAIYRAGRTIAARGLAVGIVLVTLYGIFFPHIHDLPSELHNARWEMAVVAATMGLGMLLRLMSEPASALIQTLGKHYRDNLFVTQAEGLWVGISVIGLLSPGYRGNTSGSGSRIAFVGAAFAVASGYLLLRRRWEARPLLRAASADTSAPENLIHALLKFGVLVAVAQLADFLYAPTDFILINRFLDPTLVAIYTPAVQIDSGLLLLVSGVAAMLLPRAAMAHAAGRTAALRRYYAWGTLGTTGLLALAALCIWAVAPGLLRFWLHEDLPLTVAILPWILLHTVVGGSAAVGRSVLLAMGKVQPFSTSVLIAGAVNVIVSYVLAVPMHLGLWGIVLGTVAAVVGRCGVWMPWYVLRVLRQSERAGLTRK